MKKQRHPKEHHDAHHIIPRSRGGTNDKRNLYFWPKNHHEKHTAWHALFINKMPAEVVALIYTWKRKDGELDMRYFRGCKGKVDLDKLRWWKILFEDMRPDEAAAWIKREFIGVQDSNKIN